jgi:hypothetical protein
MNKLLLPFKSLSEGYYRVILVSFILVPLIVALLLSFANALSIMNLDSYSEYVFFKVFGFGIPIYYVLARIGLWIYEGFKK